VSTGSNARRAGGQQLRHGPLAFPSVAVTTTINAFGSAIAQEHFLGFPMGLIPRYLQ
jgi:hypothetical protein